MAEAVEKVEHSPENIKKKSLEEKPELTEAEQDEMELQKKMMTFDFDPDLVLAPSIVVRKMSRQFINLFRGMEDYKLDLTELPQDLVDWETEVTDNWRLEKIFPSPDKINDEVACSWCEKIAEPPVFICKDGHFICGKEIHNVPNCPYLRDRMCHREFVSARPLFYEYMYFESKMECRNKKNGCKEIFFGRDKSQHDTFCEYDFDS